MHQQARRSKSDQLNHSKNMKEQNGGSGPIQIVRKRSSSLAEKAIRGQDSYEFKIPTLTPPGTPPSETRTRAQTLIGEIDLSLYHGHFEEENILNEVDEDTITNDGEQLGKLTCQILHDTYKHTLNIEILNVDVKAIPSSFVKGSNWVIKPIFKIEIKRNHQSPTVVRKTSTAFRKTSVFQSMHKTDQFIITTIGHTCELPFKHKTPSNFSLRITLYDVHWKHENLQIGYVHIPISARFGVESKIEEEIISHSEFSHIENLNEAAIELRTQLMWNPQDNLITLQILSANQLNKSCSGKEYYIKIVTFIENKEYSEYKTEHNEGNHHEINFNESIRIHIEPPNKIENIAIFLQLMVKHRLGHDNIGQTVIGPYMKKTIDDNLSVWEKMIISPYKNVSYTTSLHT